VSGGDAIDSEVRRGRNRGGHKSCGDLEIPVPLRLREEHNCCSKEGVEKLCRNTELKELAELSQHEELQDLKLHGGKMI